MQKILNLTIFPNDDIDRELAYYMTKMNTVRMLSMI